VVVSSETPRHSLAIVVQRSGSSLWTRLRTFLMTCSSWEPDGVLTQSLPSSSSQPLWMSSVTSPPSSTTSCGPLPPGNEIALPACRSQYSSSVSPFQAKTGVPVFRDGGGGVVLRREDVARGPAHVGAELLQRLDEHRGLDRHVQRAGDAHAGERLAGPNFLRTDMRPGISCSATEISLRPQSASEMSLTW
jgi:hypothetical protein